MPASPEIRTVAGGGIAPWLDDVARLRIEVFRAWPYLYEGSLDYERGYITRYARARTGTIVVALDGAGNEARVVGASTALALDEEADYVRAPFVQAGMDTAQIFYFGESVLLPQYRGRGLARAMVNEIVQIARNVGLERVEAEFIGEQEAAIKMFALLGFSNLVRLENYVKDMQAISHDYVLMGVDLKVDEDYAGVGG